MPVYYGLKTVFIHIPKSAGSVMAQELFKENNAIGGLSQELDKHESAFAVANYMKYDLYLDFFKFAFVRNPFDRIVSWFHYYQNLWKNPEDKPCNQECIERFLDMDFNTWVKSLKNYEHGGCRSEIACPFHFIANQYQYVIWNDGRIFVDFIGKFENINEDWAMVCDKIGLTSSTLPILNKTEHKDYHSYYTNETKDIISLQYSKDFDFFDYSF